MRGRKLKSAKILKFEAKTHISKADLSAREKAEVHIGDSVFIAPDYVQADPVASAKWKELLCLYRDAPTPDLVTTADIDTIAQYCSLFSEQRELMCLRAKAKQPKRKLKYTTALRENRDQMLKYSNHLYLNPVARVRNIPKTEKKKMESPLEKAGFGYV